MRRRPRAMPLPPPALPPPPAAARGFACPAPPHWPVCNAACTLGGAFGPGAAAAADTPTRALQGGQTAQAAMEPDRSDGTAEASSSSSGSQPACYLISYNQQSKHNIGARGQGACCWLAARRWPRPCSALLAGCHRSRKPASRPACTPPALPCRHPGALRHGLQCEAGGRLPLLWSYLPVPARARLPCPSSSRWVSPSGPPTASPLPLQHTRSSAGVPGWLSAVQHIWGARRQRSRELQPLPHTRRLRAGPEGEKRCAAAARRRAGPVRQPRRALLPRRRAGCGVSACGAVCRHLSTCAHAERAPRSNVQGDLCLAGCTVVGVEIMDGARSVHAFPFKGNTAFMLGNEVRGHSQQCNMLPEMLWPCTRQIACWGCPCAWVPRRRLGATAAAGRPRCHAGGPCPASHDLAPDAASPALCRARG